MLKGRNIVVKKLGNRIYLPTTKPFDIELPDNIPQRPYSMCHITNYEDDTGIIHLKLLPDIVNEEKFLIAIEVNSDALLSTNIKKLIFDNLSPKVPYSPAKKNDALNGNDDVYEERVSKYVLKKPPY